MKKWVIIGVVVLAALGFGIWFWSLGSLPKDEPVSVTLDVVDQTVEVRAPSGSSWEAAEDGMELGTGWSIRTGSAGSAIITFYEQGESRLEHSTEVTISESMIDAEDATQVAIRIKLDLGRVWSRVLKLFDLESSYEVETSSVVATVRGTAFDVEAKADGSSEIWVSESSVTIEPKGDGDEGSDEVGMDIMTTTTRSETDYDSAGRETAFIETTTSTESPKLYDEFGRRFNYTDLTLRAYDRRTAVPEGRSINYNSLGQVIASKEISEETKAKPWFRLNALADEEYSKDIKAKRRAKLKRLGGARPDSPLAGISRLSERVHLALSDEKARERRGTQYFSRRLARLIELVEGGKAGLAAQELARLENYIKEELKGDAGLKERMRIKRALAEVAVLVDDVDPDSPLFQFKQRFEDLSQALTEGSWDLLYVRLLSLNARLDEAQHLIRLGRLNQAKMALAAVRNGIENIERDLEGGLNEMGAQAMRDLTAKMSAVRAREDAISERLRAATETDMPSTTSTDDGTATTTEPIPPPTEPPPTTPPTTTPPPTTPPPTTPPTPSNPLYSQINLYIQPNPIDVGAVANLIVIGTKSDGTGETNLSSLSNFSITSGAGSLNGPTIRGTVQGTVTVQATYNDGGQIRTSSNSLNVKGQAVLQSLIVSSSGGTTLTRGKTTQFYGTAHYSDGYDKNVTNLTTFVNQNPSSGTLNGSLFTPSANFYGTTVIEGTFTENSVTVVGSITITIN